MAAVGRFGPGGGVVRGGGGGGGGYSQFFCIRRPQPQGKGGTLIFFIDT